MHERVPRSLQLRRTVGERTVCIHLAGTIDEGFDIDDLLEDLAPVIVLDLEKVRRVTSFGVRQWSLAMKHIPGHVAHVYLARCSPLFVDQLNLVLNFSGRAEVLSAFVPYFCEQCNEERLVLVDVLDERARLARGEAPVAACQKCARRLRFADDPHQYFRFAALYGARALDAAAAHLLSDIGVYEARRSSAPAEISKLVHGRVTLFKLSGSLDARFRPLRYAAGVEGEVVIDLGAVEGIDRDGAEAWRGFLAALNAGDKVTLVEVSEAALPAILTGRMATGGPTLHSLRSRFRCADGHESVRSITGAVTGRETCGRCGAAVSLVVPSDVVTGALALGDAARPLPEHVEEVIRLRGELLSRAQAELGMPALRPEPGSGSYRVVRPLVVGGMANVLLALRHGPGGFQKLVALKRIRGDMLRQRNLAVELFLNEARITANLSHPNIAQVFDVREDGGDLIIAMEYVHGVDLRRLIATSAAQRRRLPLELVASIGAHVASALAHAYEARDLDGRPLRIVHRDVSPANVMVTFDGQVKLVDFGVASATVLEGAMVPFGKLAYMSPEQLCARPLDGRSDVFSLGAVLYELATARPLFARPTAQATRMAVLSEPIPSLTEDAAVALEPVLMPALARDPELRYPSAHELERALRQLIDNLRRPTGAHELADVLRELFPSEAGRSPLDPNGTPAG
jgi:tRNA A-37 threonylcarbamoyl transferase component Bud32